MKLSKAFSLLFDLLDAFKVALLPTLRLTSIAGSPLRFFLSPAEISRTFMANVWANGFADGTDTNARPVKEHLITPNAYGAVLDIGAGHGHTVQYLDRSRVTKYIALEPNALMHDKIRESAAKGNFFESDGSLVILSHGAEDSGSILASLSSGTTSTTPSPPPVDTIIAVLTICTIPTPEKALYNLTRDVLRSGGQFLFYEHVLSDRQDVAWWQRFWAPLWQQAFDGCRLDRPSHIWVKTLGAGGPDDKSGSMWKEGETWEKPGEDVENLFWHQVGRFVKA